MAIVIRTYVISAGSPGAERKRIIEKAPAKEKARATLLPTNMIMTAITTGNKTSVNENFCGDTREL